MKFEFSCKEVLEAIERKEKRLSFLAGARWGKERSMTTDWGLRRIAERFRHVQAIKEPFQKLPPNTICNLTLDECLDYGLMGGGDYEV